MNIRKNLLYPTVFAAGMAVTAVELTASRIFAPYFGAGLFVWTNIIGVVLLALSLGYYFGGRMADRGNTTLHRRRFFGILFIAGIFTVVLPWISRPVFHLAYLAMPKGQLSIFFPSLISALLLFSVPIFLLGMIGPLAARIAIDEVQTAGSRVGNLYAVSTAGSIVGVFVPVLLTIPYLGSRETFYLFGSLLLMMGALGLKKTIFFLALLIPLVLTFWQPPIKPAADLEWEGESVYNYAQVQGDLEGGKALRLDEGIGLHSVYHPRRILTGNYWDGAALLPALHPGGKNFLFIGLAGGTSAQIVHFFFPEMQLSGVEIDPFLIQIGKKFFGLQEIPIRIFSGDGRLFLERGEEKYDFIMLDVYSHNLTLPPHLMTREFFETLKSRLSESGALFFNLCSTSAHPDLLPSVKKTLGQVFPISYESNLPSVPSVLIFAFKTIPTLNLDWEKIPKALHPTLRYLLAHFTPIVSSGKARIFTDNRSNLEFLSAQSAFGVPADCGN